MKIKNETFVKMANEKGKELVDWSELDKEKKKEVMSNIEKYLVVF